MVKSKLESIRERIYLIIPIICIGIWALFNLIQEGLIDKRYNENYYNDFTAFYRVGKLIFTNPQDLYKPENEYFYKPAVDFLTLFFCRQYFKITLEAI